MAAIPVEFSEQEALAVFRQKKAEHERELARAEQKKHASLKIVRYEHRHDSRGSLTQVEHLHAKHLHDRYGDKLKEIRLAPGSSSSGFGPHMMVVNEDTQMQPSDVVDLKMPFLNTMMIPIDVPPGTSEKEIRALHQETLLSYISSLSRSAPRVATHFASDGNDSALWPLYFPESKSHIGIYRTKNPNRFFLIAAVHAGRDLANDLVSIITEPGMTAGRLAADARVRWMRKVAKRNCAGVLYGAAQALKYAVNFTTDTSAFADGIASKPLLAVPCHHTAHNTFAQCHRNKSHVVFFHGTSNSFMSTGKPLTHGGFFHGYAQGVHEYGPLTTAEMIAGDEGLGQKKHRKHRARTHRMRNKEKKRATMTHVKFEKFEQRYLPTFVVAR